MDAAIAHFTISADWAAEGLLPSHALDAYATHGYLLLRGFATQT
jgi:hypothetical protein